MFIKILEINVLQMVFLTFLKQINCFSIYIVNAIYKNNYDVVK